MDDGDWPEGGQACRPYGLSMAAGAAGVTGLAVMYGSKPSALGSCGLELWLWPLLELSSGNCGGLAASCLTWGVPGGPSGIAGLVG